MYTKKIIKKMGRKAFIGSELIFSDTVHQFLQVLTLSHKYNSVKYDDVLHDAKDLPDHLLHGGGPALVAGLAPGDALVPLDQWLAIRTYYVTI